MVGASARAAMMSLARAGFSAWAVDLFADRDLARLAPVARCSFENYPDALPRLAEQFPPGPVLYTGGLENYPDVVRELAGRRPLWGNGPDGLTRVRDPYALSDVLVPPGIADTPIISSRAVAPDAVRCVWKSFRSTGGLGVRFAQPGAPTPAGCYLQEFVDGPSMSAQFVTSAEHTTLLAVTDQLAGEPWLHSRPFTYCGNIGPVYVSSELVGILSQIGDAVGRWARLRGVWGVDFILRDGQPYPVDVNPRYTAGLEVVEYGCRYAPLADHVEAFGLSPCPAGPCPRTSRVVGKAIYFAPHPVVFPPAGPWDADLTGEFDPWRLPGFADIPHPGEPIDAGSPVLTVFASGSTPAECGEQLQSRAAELDELFGAKRSPSP